MKINFMTYFWVRTTIFSKPEQKSKIQLCKGLNTNKIANTERDLFHQY